MSNLPFYLRDTPELKDEHRNDTAAKLSYVYYILDEQIDTLRMDAETLEPGECFTLEECDKIRSRNTAVVKELKEITEPLMWTILDHYPDDFFDREDFYTERDKETIRERGGYCL